MIKHYADLKADLSLAHFHQRGFPKFDLRDLDS